MTQTPIADIAVGDIILDGIPSIVETVIPREFGEFTFFVEDGNGYRNMIRCDGGILFKIDWTRDEWDAYRAL